jgi:hypothetical protein
LNYKSKSPEKEIKVAPVARRPAKTLIEDWILELPWSLDLGAWSFL